MILAAAALLLQLSAVPQSAITHIGPDPAREDALSEPISFLAAREKDPDDARPTIALLTPPADQPVSSLPLEPGRLTPTPVASAPSSSKPEAALAPSPEPAPAAFVSSSPAFDGDKAHERRDGYIWLGLSAMGHSAATFDAWTTRRVVASGTGHEMDPLLRPFAGNDSLYAAIQAGPLALEYVGYRMMHSHHAWERRTWWVPQTLGAAMNFASGAHNLGVH